MPYKPRPKVCEYCSLEWMAKSPKLRTCSYTCSARLREIENPSPGKPKRVYPPALAEEVCGMYQLGMTVAEIQKAAPGGAKIQLILERYLPERRVAAKRDQAGEKNHMWKNDPGYSAVHLRLKALRGTAGGHSCVDCGQLADNWSYSNSCPEEIVDARGRRYSTDAEQYVPRCTTCHREFDARYRAKEVVHHV